MDAVACFLFFNITIRANCLTSIQVPAPAATS
jgi:hypothetical protein